jgi:hypothetical protein
MLAPAGQPADLAPLAAETGGESPEQNSAEENSKFALVILHDNKCMSLEMTKSFKQSVDESWATDIIFCVPLTTVPLGLRTLAGWK